MNTELETQLDAISVARAYIHHNETAVMSILQQYRRKQDIKALALAGMGLVGLLVETLVPEDPDGYLDALAQRFRGALG